MLKQEPDITLNMYKYILTYIQLKEPERDKKKKEPLMHMRVYKCIHTQTRKGNSGCPRGVMVTTVKQ